MAEVVCDTSPLFYLDRLGRLEILQALHGRILAPPAVVRELAAGVEMGIVTTDLSTLAWVESPEPDATAFSQTPPGLGLGEREVLALGIQAPDRLLILDDRAARRIALEWRLSYTGTLGVLLEAKRQGKIESVSPLIDELLDRGFRIDSRILATVLRLAGEAR